MAKRKATTLKKNLIILQAHPSIRHVMRSGIGPNFFFLSNCALQYICIYIYTIYKIHICVHIDIITINHTYEYSVW